MTGRLVADGKRGRIYAALKPILLRLGVSAAQWTLASTAFGQYFRNGDLLQKKAA